MPRFNIISAFFLITTLFIASGCGGSGGGGYGAKPWQYKTAKQDAVAEPSSLSESYSGNKSDNRNIMSGSQIEQMPLGEDTRPYQAQQTQPRQQPVKVALLLPLTGDRAHLGQAMLKASQMALFDIGGTSFELLPRDTKGTPQGARDAARAAIQDGAQLVLGPVFAPSVRAAKNVTQSAGVNMISFSTDWTLSGGNTFIMGFLPFDQIERVVNYASAQGLERIGVLAPNTDYGSAVLSAYRAMAARTGIQTVDISLFAPSSSNLSPTVRDFARYDQRSVGMNSTNEGATIAPPPFDAVLLPVGGDLARSTSNLLSHYDLSPRDVKRLGTGLWDDLGLASEPSLAGGWFAAPSPRSRAKFEERYNILYKEPSPRLASLAYDATALAAILAQTGLKNYGRPAFDRSSISNPNGFSGIDGIFRFRSDGIVERGLAVLEFRNGKIVIIDDAPRSFRQQQKSRPQQQTSRVRTPQQPSSQSQSQNQPGTTKTQPSQPPPGKKQNQPPGRL